ncbi:MAG: citramalate synthase [Candidatus Aenigmarchaeota archaeon]|nr:citramalate synthase [Candidatus Aenigmarchaeota archaeon]
MNAGSWNEVTDFISPKNAKKLILYDTTLRDGAQTHGLKFSLDDKLSISGKLSDFGFDYIEAGWPSSNPRDKKYFENVKGMGLKAKSAVFGMTSPSPGKDKKIDDLLKTEADVITVFGKSWDLHVKDVLRMSPDKNLRMVSDTIEYLKSHDFRVFFDAEHFFDGYKANPDYALKVLDAAKSAEALVLCDTNGGSMPWEIEKISCAVSKAVSSEIGVHMHNDTGMAVMNTLSAMRNSAFHVQGTMNGLGERCGNMDWCEFLPLTGIKLGMKLDIDMKKLFSLSRYIVRMTGFSLAKNKPFIGANAFSHKGGVHIDAMLKNSRAYEHMNPDDVGNSRLFSLSEQSGRSGIVDAAGRHGYSLGKNDPLIIEMMEVMNRGEVTTDAELFLMLSEKINRKKDAFSLVSYETAVSSKGVAKTEVKVSVGNDTFHEIAEGVGPVHSLDVALRKALSKKFSVDNLKLTNYRVRIINQDKATAAIVEVFIEFRAGDKSWSTSGASDDIIKASRDALIKGYNYYLLKNGG